jgi:hypothetical protein
MLRSSHATTMHMSKGSAMSHDRTSPQASSEHAHARGGLSARSVLVGLAGAVIGMIIGFIVGADIGGNWMTGVSLGAHHGYEATAMVGAVFGAIVLGTLSFWLARRRRS